MHGTFKRGGINWALDLNEGIDFAIYLLGTFERDLAQKYKRLIKAGATVLDIGANIGAHTLPLARQVTNTGKVVAIEATAYARTKLDKNLSLNPDLIPQTMVVQALLTAYDDAPTENQISSSWPIAGAEPTEEVLCGALRSTEGSRTISLDTLLQELGVQQVDWIKLDVDGHELSVLQGARSTLTRQKPNIFMELAPYCYSQIPNGFSDLITILTNAGYTMYTLDKNQRLDPNPDYLKKHVIPENGSINILAMAK